MNSARELSQWFGLVDYAKALELQQQAWGLTKQDGRSRILGFEHPPVVTLGKRANRDIDIEPTCEMPLINIDRGGQATVHSPGQLVIYPIVSLVSLNMGVRELVNEFAMASCQFLERLGVEAQFRDDSPGIYTVRGKIGFIGIRVTEGVSRHGLSINIQNDLALFGQIRSCGVSQASLDKLSDWDIQMTPERAFQAWLQCLSDPIVLGTKSSISQCARSSVG